MLSKSHPHPHPMFLLRIDHKKRLIGGLVDLTEACVYVSSLNFF